MMDTALGLGCDMAIGYNPSIVTSNLILYLDAGNPRSYPGTGTNWYDASGEDNNGTVANGPIYTTGTSGYFTFDGVDDYGQIPKSSGFFDINTNSLYADTGYAWTVGVWFSFPVSPVGTRTGNQSFSLLGKSGGIATAATWTLFLGSATDTTYGQYAPYKLATTIRGAVTVISVDSLNTGLFNNAVVTWNGSTGRAYLNGSDMGALTVGAAAAQNGYYFSLGTTANAGSGAAASSHQYEGKISQVSVYNVALTAGQVLQNYNALRGRYGL